MCPDGRWCRSDWERVVVGSTAGSLDSHFCEDMRQTVMGVLGYLAFVCVGSQHRM